MATVNPTTSHQTRLGIASTPARAGCGAHHRPSVVTTGGVEGYARGPGMCLPLAPTPEGTCHSRSWGQTCGSQPGGDQPGPAARRATARVLPHARADPDRSSAGERPTRAVDPARGPGDPSPLPAPRWQAPRRL